MTKWMERDIGPRKIDGVYLSGYWRTRYTVKEINITDDRWDMKVAWNDDGSESIHCTAWDYKRDKVLG